MDDIRLSSDLTKVVVDLARLRETSAAALLNSAILHYCDTALKLGGFGTDLSKRIMENMGQQIDHLELVSAWFGMRCTKVSVPATLNGRQQISVVFENGSDVSVESDTIEGAWRCLYDTAKAQAADRAQPSALPVAYGECSCPCHTHPILHIKPCCHPEPTSILPVIIPDVVTLAKAMHPLLWSDDPKVAHIAASPFHVESARRKALVNAELIIEELRKLTATAQ